MVGYYQNNSTPVTGFVKIQKVSNIYLYHCGSDTFPMFVLFSFFWGGRLGRINLPDPRWAGVKISTKGAKKFFEQQDQKQRRCTAPSHGIWGNSLLDAENEYLTYE